MPQVYTIGNDYPIGQFPTGKYPLGALSRRRPFGGRMRFFGGLGDDTPNAIRIYVPRLATGLRALELYSFPPTPEGRLTWADAPPDPGTLATVWGDEIATQFARHAQRYLGFVPVIHEPAGAEVVYAHMLGATTHTQAERIWAPLQNAINTARTAVGAPAPTDPYANRPRAWTEGTAIPPSGGAPAPAPVATGSEAVPLVQSASRSAGEILVGSSMLILSMVI